MANIPGTPKNDVINGTNFDDILNQDGNLLSYPGTGGNDTVYGFGGNDRLYGGVGNDVLVGDSGNDRLSGGIGDDGLHGGTDHDQLFGGAGNDYLSSGEGDDVLDGGTGADRMFGGAGYDIYYVDDTGDQTSEDSNDALGGYDRVYASATHTMGFGIEDLFLTGAAAINGTGNENNNTIFGNDANNVLAGLDGDDALIGVNGHDQLIGGNGNDHLFDGNGNDTLNGGAGTDTVNYANATAGVRVNLALTGAQNTGGAGSDTLSQVEILFGTYFNDTLTGNAANNSLYGNNGDDTLTGGRGADFLNGGLGNDRFDYNAVSDSPAGAGRDVITEFAGAGTALGDQIDLRDIDANTLVTGNQAFQWRGATPGGAGTLWYSGGVLYGNVDADAVAEFEIQLVGIRGLSVGGTGTDILL
ncbi:MAG: calcium-binding protein [Nitrospira sp.]